MVKCLIVLEAVLFAAGAVTAGDAQGYVDMREQVMSLRKELSRQSAYALVTNHAVLPRVAPHIHSQCWVDWLPRTNVAQIAYEQEKRDFGLDFVDKLEELALRKTPLGDADAHERRVEEALAIAEWMKTAKGYGNQILKRWCEGMALSSLGSMSVNPQCDTNRVLKLIVRVDDLHENLVRQVAILNEEAPHRFAIPKGTTCEETVSALEKQWMPHIWAAFRHFDRQRKDNGRIFEYSQVMDRKPEFAFYMPDSRGRGGSGDPVKNFWKRKSHSEVCIYATDEEMVEQICQLLRYRTLLGNLPNPTAAELKDPNLAFMFRSRLHGKWRALTKGKEFFFVGADAVLKIHNQRFVDLRTAELLLYRELEERKSSLKTQGR